MISKIISLYETKGITAISDSFKSFEGFIFFVTAFCSLVFALSNFCFQAFHITLIPEVQSFFELVHFFLKGIFEVCIWSWLSGPIEFITFTISFYLGLFFLELPTWRQIKFPSLWADLALLSICISRAFSVVDSFVTPKDRKIAFDETDDDCKYILETGGGILGKIHRVIQAIHCFFRDRIESLSKKLGKNLGGHIKITNFCRGLLTYLVSFFLLWGLLRIAGYVLNLIWARKVNCVIMDKRRETMRFFLLTLIGAFIATLAFIFGNSLFGSNSKSLF